MPSADRKSSVRSEGFLWRCRTFRWFPQSRNGIREREVVKRPAKSVSPSYRCLWRKTRPQKIEIQNSVQQGGSTRLAGHDQRFRKDWHSSRATLHEEKSFSEGA